MEDCLGLVVGMSICNDMDISIGMGIRTRMGLRRVGYHHRILISVALFGWMLVALGLAFVVLIVGSI